MCCSAFVWRSLEGVFTIVAIGSCGGATAGSTADPVVASMVADIVGVPDRGLDPSVVVVAGSRGEVCSGVLLASDVVLTARQCVTTYAEPVDCLSTDPPAAPTADPAAIHVYNQMPSSTFTWGSSALAVLTSNDQTICGADLAVVILEWPIDGAQPVLVSESGSAQGGHVRTVGVGWASSTAAAQSELLREHLPVLDVSASELVVGEASCVGAPGGPAFDETTGEVVGILSRWGTLCGASGQFDVYARTDTFYGLVQDALAWEPALVSVGVDGGTKHSRDSGKKREAGRSKKPPTDIGAACLAAATCGTGLCVTAEGSQYCSRTCAPADPCPTHFKCVIASDGASVCVRS